MRAHPDAAFLQELTSVSFQPIFILGLHRSGTSILYDLLAKTGSFNVLTAYHIINYDELLSNRHLKREDEARERLTKSLQEDGLQDRGIDRMRISADFPEEYGFLLNRKTFYMHLTRRNTAFFSEMCRKIQYLSGNDKPLLLKNPYDFRNFVFIKHAFPTARFIFTHRHPLRSISSSIHAMRTLLHDTNPYSAMLSPSYGRLSSSPLLLAPLRFVSTTVPELGVALIASITANAASYYLRNKNALPREDHIAITYEELCAHPQQAIEAILHRFSLDRTTSIDARTFIEPRELEVDRSVQKLAPYISRCMREYLEEFHYTVDC